MSIKDRVEDALFLASHGRADGALMVVLLAVAGASAARYPGDRKTNCEYQAIAAAAKAKKIDLPPFDFWRFSEYLNPRLLHLITGDPNAAKSLFAVQFRGTQIDAAEVLYKHFRNELVHQSALPAHVSWNPSTQGETADIGFGGDGNELSLSGNWIELLARVALDEMPAARPKPVVHRLRTKPGIDYSDLLSSKDFAFTPTTLDPFLQTIGSVSSGEVFAAGDHTWQTQFEYILSFGEVLPRHLERMQDASLIGDNHVLTQHGQRAIRWLIEQHVFDIPPTASE